MRILVFALSGIGDALMFSPTISLIRKNFPEAEIDLMCMFKGVKEIYENNPNINRVIYFDFMKEGFLKSLFFLFKLRKKYDVSFNVYPSNRKEYNVISFLVGAKERYAIQYLRQDFINFGFLNNLRIIENDYLHNVEENLNLGRLFLQTHNIFCDDDDFSLQIFFNQNAIDFARQWLSDNNINQQDYVVGFHAGCAVLKNHIKRRWEPEKFADLGSRLIEKLNAKILLFGGPDEYELNEKINSLMHNKAIIVKTNSLLQTAAIMKRCNLFVTNDSALMHIASALKLNVVAIFGPTNTNYVHPYKTRYQIARLNLECQPCFYYSPKPLTCSRSDVKFKCIKELSVDLVEDKIYQFISELNK
ncbi:MAG: glycosyltransferase family 9 protein [Ignavibacteria bacterium]|nr:glycosyltransferase family 9 protein [Ignavibacteria bacterium]